MPFVPVAATARAAITFEDNGGNQAVNVQHFQDTAGPITLARLGILADAIEGWLMATWANFTPTVWRAVNLDLLDLTAEDSFYLSRALDVSGLDTAESLPSWVTLAISLRTGLSGRSRRGRLYQVGISDSRAAGDYVTEAAATAYITGYTLLKEEVTDADWQWVVVSYVGDGVPRAAGLVTPITDVTIADRKLDRQIRRKP